MAENCGWFDEDILQQVVLMNELLVIGIKPVLETTENLQIWLFKFSVKWGDDNNLALDFEQDMNLDSLLLMCNISL